MVVVLATGWKRLQKQESPQYCELIENKDRGAVQNNWITQDIRCYSVLHGIKLALNIG